MISTTPARLKRYPRLSLCLFPLMLALVACAPQRVQPLAPTPVSLIATSESLEKSPSLAYAERLQYEYSEDVPEEDVADISIDTPPASGKAKLIRPTQSQTIGSVFGMRFHPTMRKRTLHTGVDIQAKRGDKAVAATSGKVIFSGRNGAYGLMIDIDAGDGMVLRYAHLDKLGVKVGAKVKQGQYVGNVGRTGRVTAAHLHFEVRIKGKPVNPLAYITTSDHKWAVNTPSSKNKKTSNKKL